MTQNINAEIISIGTEILLGEITDTNSVFISRAMRDIGVNVFYMSSVGDNRERIAGVIRQALQRSHIVITCGGLGPTVDDMTRQGVADATDCELVFHQSLLDQIAARFATFRVQMTDNNKRQAYLPELATLVQNPVGTAPSFFVERDDRVVISLPGVPREMQYLMNETIIPYLRQKYQLGIIKARTLKTAGIGESSLDQRIGTEILEQHNPTVGLAAHSGQVDIRITAKADNEDIANTMLDGTETRVRERVGDYIYGYDHDSMEDVMVAALRQYSARISFIEAGVSGAISDIFQNLDDTVIADTQQYDHPDQVRQLVHNGELLSIRSLATIAAQDLQQKNETQINIVILSLPDIDESADSDETTAICVRVGDLERSRVYGFGGQSKLLRKWAANWAMASAWRMLHEVNSNA